MPYVDEEELEALFEEDDDDDDEEEEALMEEEDDDEFAEEEDDDDEEEFGETAAERYFRSRGQRTRLAKRTRIKKARRLTGRYGTHIRGRSSARVRTPAGTARINFGRKLVTEQELKVALTKIRGDLKKLESTDRNLTKAIGRVDKAHRAAAARQEKRLAKFEKSVDKRLKAAQQMALLPLLLQSPPKLTGLTMGLKGSSAAHCEYDVSETKYAKGDDDMLLLAMMMGGGLGGDDPSQQMLMMFLLTQK